jgi:hypothetical protein
MSDIKAKYWAEGEECEFCPKKERLNKFWWDCHGPRCPVESLRDSQDLVPKTQRVSRGRIERILLQGEIIVELDDTKELIVCRDTDILPIDRQGY